jgi:peptidoglycan hydrolase-like protein with peptidoglycan-binding domain
MNPGTMRRRARVCALSAGVMALMLPAAADARYGARTLKQGDRNHDVKVMQAFLTKAGFATTADGVFGRGTAAKLKAFERSARLVADGRLTPRDARVLRTAASRGRASAHAQGNGGSAAQTGDSSAQPTASNPGAQATLSPDGRTAIAPDSAPPEVKAAIAAANKITSKPYKYGGGHGRWEDTGYDCSGAVSYALHGAGLLDQALDSSGFMSWGDSGPGQWMTIYANSGHAYIVIAGLRFDTSGSGEKGPRWREETRSGSGYTVRHPTGF